MPITKRPMYKEDFNDFKKKSSLTLIVAVIGVIVSVAALFFNYTQLSTQLFRSTNDTLDLNKRLKQADDAIRTLIGLEEHLELVKKNIVETQKEKELIEEEYNKVKILQSLSDEQMLILKEKLVEKKTWRDVAVEQIPGIIFGFSTSLLASWVFEKYRNRNSN